MPLDPITTSALITAGGSLLGGLMGGGDAPSPEVPRWQRKGLQPYRQGFKGFGEQYNPEFFPGQTYAEQSPFTNLAIQQMGGFSTQPSQQYMSDVLSGQYLGLSPSMQAAVMNPAIEAVNARFNQMGRFGSQANVENASEAAMRALMPYYGQERGMQQQAAFGLPQLQQQQYGQQLQAGGLQEQYAQQPIDEAMARWQFQQEAPYNQMSKWASLAGPITGAQFYQPQSGGSTLSGILGGGLAGASIANQFGLLSNPATQAAQQYTSTNVPGVDPYTWNRWGV